MSAATFDPFEDRLSRDIRNSLSSVFMETLEKKDLRYVQQEAANYLQKVIDPVYHDYIRDRLNRYENSFHKIAESGNENVIFKALILWDQELFFEVHELLEEAWLHATGNNRKILQGLIRAAGVYVHLHRGNMKGATKMAAKAREALSVYRDELPDFVNLEILLNSLETLDRNPPKLLDV